MSRLQDKVAVITGGNSGIGFASAQAFINAGARVAIFGRDRASLDTSVEALGENAIAIQGDVTSDADLDNLYTTTNHHFGKVDVVFANAGTAEFMSLEDATNDHLDKLFDINVKGLFKTVRQSLGALNDNASIILTSSITNEKGIPRMSAYSASKAAVRSFARSFSAELVSRGIRVNALSPGPVATSIYARAGLSEEQIEGLGEEMTNQIPLKRFGEVNEMADAAVFLASSESSFIVGDELVVDGGMTQL